MAYEIRTFIEGKRRINRGERRINEEKKTCFWNGVLKKTAIIWLSALLSAASCTDNSWRGVSDSDYDDYDNGIPVPVVVGVGDSGTSYTKGSGAIDNEDGRPWKDANVYVYAFRQDGDSFARLARASGNDCLIDASLDSASERGGRRAWYSGADEYLTWADSEADVYYPSGKETYDFYAYYIDNLRIPDSSVTRTADCIKFPVTIDGSTDIMTGRAKFSDTMFDGTQFSEIEKGMIRKYAFSSYTARRNINPILEFSHHLARLRFEMYPASDKANTVIVNSITVKSRTSGVFTAVSRDSDAVGVDFSSDRNPKALSLAEADGSALLQNRYHTDYAGDFSEALYERPHVQVGGTLLVAPDSGYEVEITMLEAKGRDYRTSTSFKLSVAGGFAAGRQYAVRLAIYGMMDVRPAVKLEPWGTGGGVRLDEEDNIK